MTPDILMISRIRKRTGSPLHHVRRACEEADSEADAEALLRRRSLPAMGPTGESPEWHYARGVWR